MARMAYLTRRGGIFWFRRRPPQLRIREKGLLGSSGPNATRARPPAQAHLALSLRTRCPIEARRRAARVAAIFEFAWQRYEIAASHIPPAEEARFREPFA